MNHVPDPGRDFGGGGSRPIGPGATCLAAQVEHTAFYMVVVLAGIEDADWAGSCSVTAVSELEWTALKERFQIACGAMRATIMTRANWHEDCNANVLGLIGHDGFQLGQIREGLACFAAP